MVIYPRAFFRLLLPRFKITLRAAIHGVVRSGHGRAFRWPRSGSLGHFFWATPWSHCIVVHVCYMTHWQRVPRVWLSTPAHGLVRKPTRGLWVSTRRDRSSTGRITAHWNAFIAVFVAMVVMVRQAWACFIASPTNWKWISAGYRSLPNVHWLAYLVNLSHYCLLLGEKER